MIAAMMEQVKTKEWSKLLPRIQFNQNTQKFSSKKFMPFEFFLNKKTNFGTKNMNLLIQIKMVMKLNVLTINNQQLCQTHRYLLTN